MSKKMLVGLCVLVFGMGVAMAATNVDVSLTITPNPGLVSVTADPVNVYFGEVEVARSSAPAQKVLIKNESAGGITLEKCVQSISADDVWTLAKATGSVDDCVVWCLEANTQPTLWDAVWDADTTGEYDADVSSMSTTLTANILLLDDAGLHNVLGANKEATTWYKIAVPSTVNEVCEQTIVIKFTGTLN